jgi:hypothetical protein
MITLVAGLYSNFETTVNPSFEGISPAIISLFETFWDERFEKYQVSCVIFHCDTEAQGAQENTCIVDFRRLEDHGQKSSFVP